MTTTADADAPFLRAIIDRPHDDTPRLVWADYLEETAETLVCERCQGTGSHALNPYELAALYGTHRAGQMLDASRCGVCSGSGRVPDGRLARAEFIRVQCELARLDGHDCREHTPRPRGPGGQMMPRCRACDREDDLRQREQELFDAHCDRWFPVPKGYGLDWHLALSPDADVRPKYVVRRGFVAEVRCPLAALVGPCGRCGGARLLCPGEYESAVGRFDPPGPGPDDCADCGGVRDEHTPCPDCSGTGSAVTPAAVALFRSQPVTRVVATDKEPEPWTGSNPAPVYSWFGVGFAADAATLPRSVFDRLACHVGADTRQIYPSPALARDALSAAVIAACRAAAFPA